MTEQAWPITLWEAPASTEQVWPITLWDGSPPSEGYLWYDVLVEGVDAFKRPLYAPLTVDPVYAELAGNPVHADLDPNPVTVELAVAPVYVTVELEFTVEEAGS